jgi:predicted dehydrogenase
VTEKKKATNISRRTFTKSAAAAFGFTVLPSYLALGRADAAGNVPPSNRVNLGCVGTGGQAYGDIKNLIKGGATPVAFCDVDPVRGAIGKWKKEYPKAPVFKDFRVMLDKMGKDIDAVSVAIPDHCHFVAAMDAMRRGKHVYVEKPLTHSFREAELLMKAEKKYKVVTQMGNQGHTSSGCAQFKSMVENGVVSDIVRIDAWKRQGLWFMDKKKRFSDYPAKEEIPASLDWDLWCGPAEKKPFSSKYHHFDWRGFYLYGTGMFGDWGAHLIDMAHDFLKLGLPTKITPHRLNDHNKILFPLASYIQMNFPARGEGLPACELHWRDGVGYWDVWHEVDKMTQYHTKKDDGKVDKPRLGHAGTFLHRKQGDYGLLRGSHAGASILYPTTKRIEFGAKLKGKSPGSHYEGFVKACKGEGKTWSPFSVGGELTQVLLLGVACQFLNTELEFDPKTKRFTNSDEGNAYLQGPKPRKDYEEFYKEI